MYTNTHDVKVKQEIIECEIAQRADRVYRGTPRYGERTRQGEWDYMMKNEQKQKLGVMSVGLMQL